MSTVKRIERLVKREVRVLTTSPEDTVSVAAAKMHYHEVGCVVVLDDSGRVVGIMTERDIIKKVVAKAQDPARTRVGDIMTKRLISCTMDTPIDEAQRRMAHHGIRHLPIIENGIPLGMISSRDVMDYQLSVTQALARQQKRTLQDLEGDHPGITQVQKDRSGRIVI